MSGRSDPAWADNQHTSEAEDAEYARWCDERQREWYEEEMYRSYEEDRITDGSWVDLCERLDRGEYDEAVDPIDLLAICSVCHWFIRDVAHPGGGRVWIAVEDGDPTCFVHPENGSLVRHSAFAPSVVQHP